MQPWKVWWFIKTIRPNVYFVSVTILCAILGWKLLVGWLAFTAITVALNLFFNDELKRHLKTGLTKAQKAREGRRDLAELNKRFDPDRR